MRVNTMYDFSQAIYDALKPELNKWFRAQCIDPCASFYLYSRNAIDDEIVAPPIIATEKPEGYELAMNERVSCAWTIEQAKYRCFDALYRFPCITTKDV